MLWFFTWEYICTTLYLIFRNYNHTFPRKEKDSRGFSNLQHCTFKIVWVRVHTCAYQGVRNVSFSENLSYVCPLKRLLQLATNFTYWRHISSTPEVFYKKGILRNFAKFTGKHLCHWLFFNKVAGLCFGGFFNKFAGLKVFVKKKLQHKGLHLY